MSKFKPQDRSYTLFVLLALVFASAIAAPLRAEELFDPTRPSYATVDTGGGKTAAPAASSFVLNAIRVSPGQRSAMINNRTVKLGEHIGDAQVVAIDRRGVRLQRGTEQIMLQLLPNKVKQAHKAIRR